MAVQDEQKRIATENGLAYVARREFGSLTIPRTPYSPA
jgi:hypothetical protein